MINLIIDGIPVEAAEDATILEAAAAAGVEIPTLCYLKDVSSIGSCRMCVVEIEGTDRMVTACNTKVKRRDDRQYEKRTSPFGAQNGFGSAFGRSPSGLFLLRQKRSL